ncbi:MAG: hypothetical protein ACJ8LG_11830 [Massilia sp.]
MASIDFKFKLSDFRILKKNESSADEPYLWTFFIRLDGSTVDLLETKPSTVTVFSPKASPSDLGPKAVAGLEITSGAIPVPPAIGEFNSTLSSDNFRKVSPALSMLEPFCSVAALVIALEADSTSESDLEVARIKVRDELQKQLNANLQLIITDVKAALSKGNQLPTQAQIEAKLSTVDIQRFVDLVKKSVFGSVINDGVGGLVGLLTGLFPPFGLAQVIDPDDFIGHAIIGPIQLSALISAGPAGVPFTRDLGSTAGSSEGDYRITGNVHRSDSTEFANLALNLATPSPAAAHLDVVVRSSLRKFSTARQVPPTAAVWTGSWADLPDGTFLSAPAVAASTDGKRLHVCGLGLDHKIWRGLSLDAGASWTLAWAPIGSGTFVSSPAAAVSADGMHLHVFGRGMDGRIWRAYSPDSGQSWPVAWVPIGTGVFNSAPAAAVSDDGKSLHVFARGMDNRIWRAFSSSGGSQWNLAWAPIGAGTFLSDPAAALSGDGQHLHVFGRGLDNRMWRAYSPNGGSAWEVAWVAIPGGSFASSPAATISPDGQQVHVAGIGNDLHVWRNLSSNSGVAWSLGWKQVPGSIAF